MSSTKSIGFDSCPRQRQKTLTNNCSALPRSTTVNSCWRRCWSSCRYSIILRSRTKKSLFFTSIDEGQNGVCDRITSTMVSVEEVWRKEVRAIDHRHHAPVMSNNKSNVAIERNPRLIFSSEREKWLTLTERNPSLIRISLIRSELMKIVVSLPIT